MRNYKVSKEDVELIDKIITRAEKEFSQYTTIDRGMLVMALIDVHANVGLELQDMLDWPHLSDFAHDIGGILNHWDPKEGKFRNCFSPRFAKQ